MHKMTAIEYGLIAALVAVALVSAWTATHPPKLADGSIRYHSSRETRN